MEEVCKELTSFSPLASNQAGSAMSLPFLFPVYSELLAKTESSQKIQIVPGMIRIYCGGICGEVISDIGDKETPGYRR
jgi:hypothetical protein